MKKQGDKLIQSNIIKNGMKKTLGVTYEEVDEEGNVLTEVSIAQKLINATIEDAIMNPDTRKLKDIANIVGELKEGNSGGVNVNITSPVEMFKGIGFGEEVIEANFRDKEN